MPTKKIIFIFILILNGFIFAQSTEVKYELNSLSFEGNDEISSTSLEYKVFSRQSPIWFWKLLHSVTGLSRGASYFDSTNIPLDLTALKEYYNANGFFDAKFSYDVETDTASKKVDLTYIIKENQQSDYGTLYLFGLKNEPDFILNNFLNDLNIDTTKKFNQDILQKNTDIALNSLLNDGYMFAKYDSTIVYRDSAKNK